MLTDFEHSSGAIPDDQGRVAHFGDPHGEYAAAKQVAAVFHLPERTQIELHGADRAKFLHSFCTNDIRGLQPGQGREAFVTNVQGKVLGHIFVFAGEESLLLDSVPGSHARLVSHFTKYHLNEDLEIRDRTAERAVFYVAGPDLPKRLDLTGAGTAQLEPLDHRTATIDGIPLTVRRVDFLGAPGWELVCSADDSSALWQRLVTLGLRPAGRQAFESLRIEAGFPWYGVDITEANLAQEVARTAQAISFTKGCYLGQEPIARIDALGHVNQELRRLTISRLPVPEPGAALLALDDRVVGRVTSAAVSYGSGLPVALAYVRRGFESSGTIVRVRSGSEAMSATVV